MTFSAFPIPTLTTTQWGLPYSVKDPAYGAVGNGVADDTAAINLAIAALNSAGSGVLFFPPGTYLVSSSLTTITASGRVEGAGICLTSSVTTATGSPTLITYTSASTPLFNVSGTSLLFAHLALQFTGVGTPTTGSAGIKCVSTGTNWQQVNYDNLIVQGFYINIDIQTGALWDMRNTYIVDPVQYGVSIQNTLNNDAGDWSMYNVVCQTLNNSPNTAIYMTSSGGGKIVNCKVNTNLSNNKFYTNGIFANGTGTTALLLVANCSIENYATTGINIVQWGSTSITGVEFGNFIGGSPTPISISNSNNISIDNIIFAGNSFNLPPIVLSGTVQNIVIGNVTIVGTYGSAQLISSGFSYAGGNLDGIGTIMGVGNGVVAQLCSSAGTTFPGSYGMTSNGAGNTVVWVDGPAAHFGEIILSQAKSIIWSITGGTGSGTSGLNVFSGGEGAVLTVDKSLGGNATLSNRFLLFGVDNNADIGTSSGNRPRAIYVGNTGITTQPLLVANLPTVGTTGRRSFVTDSTVAASTNFGAIVVGGSSNHVPVFDDGTNWRIG